MRLLMLIIGKRQSASVEKAHDDIRRAARKLAATKLDLSLEVQRLLADHGMKRAPQRNDART